jgi:hypothetical protein
LGIEETKVKLVQHPVGNSSQTERYEMKSQGSLLSPEVSPGQRAEEGFLKDHGACAVFLIPSLPSSQKRRHCVLSYCYLTMHLVAHCLSEYIFQIYIYIYNTGV